MSALELVTKAILFEDCGNTEEWRENVNLGQAAIAALREPTEAMLAAALSLSGEEGMRASVTAVLVKRDWIAMIDAALAEQVSA